MKQTFFAFLAGGLVALAFLSLGAAVKPPPRPATAAPCACPACPGDCPCGCHAASPSHN